MCFFNKVAGRARGKGETKKTTTNKNAVHLKEGFISTNCWEEESRRKGGGGLDTDILKGKGCGIRIMLGARVRCGGWGE